MKRSVWKTFGVLMAVCAMLVTALGVSTVGNANRTENQMVSFSDPRDPYTTQTALVPSSDPRDPYTVASVTLADPRDPYTRTVV